MRFENVTTLVPVRKEDQNLYYWFVKPSLNANCKTIIEDFRYDLPVGVRLNDMLKATFTPFVVIWDPGVIMPFDYCRDLIPLISDPRDRHKIFAMTPSERPDVALYHMEAFRYHRFDETLPDDQVLARFNEYIESMLNYKGVVFDRKQVLRILKDPVNIDT